MPCGPVRIGPPGVPPSRRVRTGRAESPGREDGRLITLRLPSSDPQQGAFERKTVERSGGRHCGDSVRQECCGSRLDGRRRQLVEVEATATTEAERAHTRSPALRAELLHVIPE
jgi:hypothetical protein